MRYIVFNVLGRRIKAIRYMMSDKSVKKRKKALIIAGIVYVFLPIKIIPPVLFPHIAWVDSLILWIWILWYLRDELDKYWIGEKRQDLSGSYKGKTIIDDVDYEIKDKGE